MKIYISQAIEGLDISNDAIFAVKNKYSNLEDIEVIKVNESTIEKSRDSLYFLALLYSYIAESDIVCFPKNWNASTIGQLEYNCAKNCMVEILIV